jgi:hypothetical protein
VGLAAPLFGAALARAAEARDARRAGRAAVLADRDMTRLTIAVFDVRKGIGIAGQ